MAKKSAPPLPEHGCHICRHWKEDLEPGGTERFGTCRRYPPVVLYDSDDGPFSAHPVTGPEDACGEFSAKLQ